MPWESRIGETVHYRVVDRAILSLVHDVAAKRLPAIQAGAHFPKCHGIRLLSLQQAW